MGGLLDIKIGEHAQQGGTNLDAIPARQIDEAVQWIGRGKLHAD
jgi:hypothetical protein